MKATARSDEPVGFAEPEFAAVPVLDVPAKPSSGLTAATPANSATSTAMTVAVPTVTVTDVTAAAFGAYHSSPSEKCPDVEKAPIFVQVLPPESVTLVIWLVSPV